MRLRERFKRLTFWNKITAIGSILAIMSFFIYMIDFVSNKYQESENIDRMESLLDEHFKTNHSILMQQYPLGYAVVYTTLSKPIVYVSEDLLNKEYIAVDLYNVSVAWDDSLNALMFTLPYVNYVPFNISFEDVFLGVSKVVGSRIKAVELDNFQLWIETIISQGDQIVFVLGCKEVSNQEK